MNFIDSRTEYSFWALWSAPLMIATDVRNMSAEMRSIVANPEVIAVNQDPAGRGGGRSLRVVHYALVLAPGFAATQRAHRCCGFSLGLGRGYTTLGACLDQDRVYNASDGAQVWRKELEGGDLAVILYNAHNRNTINVNAPWTLLNVSSGNVTVRDLWQRK